MNVAGRCWPRRCTGPADAVDALAVLRRVRRGLRSELGLDPGPRLVALELAVLRHDPSLSGPMDHLLNVELPAPGRRYAPGNLPAPLSSFIGRGRELESIGVLLEDERLVVLTGTGGVGKTRLALVAADVARSGFSGGVWVVELADTNDPADVAPLVAAAFGFVARDGLTAGETVTEGIRDRHVLLVLDNCEHVLDAVVEFAIDASISLHQAADPCHEPESASASRANTSCPFHRCPSSRTPSICSSTERERRWLVPARGPDGDRRDLQPCGRHSVGDRARRRPRQGDAVDRARASARNAPRCARGPAPRSR